MRTLFESSFRRARPYGVSFSRGFTLIELLVVIGLIAVLAAGIGLSMRDGNPSSALRAGQNSLVGLLSSARGQAALNQTDAMIIVDVTAGEEALRSLQVVVRTSTNPDKWRPVGDPILLPQGIYVVPPSGVATPAVLTGSWTNKRRSRGFYSTDAKTLSERDVDATYTIPKTNAFDSHTYLEFTIFSSLGAVSGSDGVLLVTSGRRSGASEITMDNPEFVRGVYLSRYGVPTFLNESDSLDKM